MLVRPLGILFTASIVATAPVAGQSPDSALHPGPWWDTTSFIDDLSASTRSALEVAAHAAHRLATIEAARGAHYQRLAAPHVNALNVLAGEHWLVNDLLHAPLDFSRPAYLMFYPMGQTRQWTLVGVAYGSLQPVGAAPPNGFTGEADVWHYHVPCVDLPGVPVALARDAEDCEAHQQSHLGVEVYQ